MVLLIGNYPPDRQQSMQRFGAMMLQGLKVSAIPAKLIAPQPFFGKLRGAGSFVTKWLGYIDKFVLFPRKLRRSLAQEKPSVVHVCDHSNAMYGHWVDDVPVVVTCHDLLAVRGALGEETNCPASLTGRILQRWILAGLGRATGIACVSHATAADAVRLIGRGQSAPPITVIENGLNYPFQPLPEKTREPHRSPEIKCLRISWQPLFPAEVRIG